MARYTRDQWLAFFSEHKASDLTAAEFCRQRNLNAKYFSCRKKQLLENDSQQTSATRSTSAFATARVASTVATQIKIQHHSVEVFLPSSLSPQWVASFVKALS
jgi:hypothetical protein